MRSRSLVSSPVSSPAGLSARARAFARDARGNFAMLTALLITPVFGMAGLGLDHWAASSAKSNIEHAADAAALAAIQRAARVMQAPGKNLAQARAAGLDAARDQFLANAGRVPLTQVAPPKIELKIDGLKVLANVEWSGQTQTTFGSLFGVRKLDIGGRSQASLSMPAYVKIFLLVDNSSSMGIGANEEEQDRLEKRDGCAVACHLQGYRYSGRFGSFTSYQWARWDKIQTRIDVVRESIADIATRIEGVRLTPDQFKIGLYEFNTNFKPVVPIDDPRAMNMKEVRQAALDMTLATVGGGTNYHRAIREMERIIANTPRGDGSSPSKPLIYFMLITDGVESSTRFDGAKWTHEPGLPVLQPRGPEKWGDIQGFNPDLCLPFRSMSNVSVMPLYLEYIMPKMRGQDHGRFQWIESNLLPRADERFRQCSSDRKLHKARTSQQINDALNAMFQQAIPELPRLRS